MSTGFFSILFLAHICDNLTGYGFNAYTTPSKYKYHYYGVDIDSQSSEADMCAQAARDSRPRTDLALSQPGWACNLGLGNM